MGDENKITDAFKKWQKRFKRAICCGVITVLLAICGVIAGIVLLAYFAKYWGNNDEWERHLAYAGLAFLLIGLVLFVGAIIVFVVVYKLYKRMEGAGKHSQPVKTMHYEPGTAPYPQQAPSMPLQPSAPESAHGGYHSTEDSDVKIDVTEYHKF